MSKRILVAGGVGFLGSALVKCLLRDGHPVRVFDNESRGSRNRLREVSSSIEFIHGDIRDTEAVMGACEGIETVFHLAAVNGTQFFYEKPDLVLEVGIRGMLNVIDACKTHKVRDLFMASSSEVYHSPSIIPTDESAPLVIPNPLNPRFSYAGSKIAGELLALHYTGNILSRVVIFRPHNVYGPDMGWEHAIPQITVQLAKLPQTSSTHRVPIEGTGKETRAFCHIDDCVSALLLLYQKGTHREIYNIGTDKETTIKELVHLIAGRLGKKIAIIPGKLKEGSPIRRCPDVSKLKALGYKSRVSLKEGLPGVVDWYAANAEKAPRI